MKIVINALQYKKNSSGLGVMIRELFGTYSGLTEHSCKIVVTKDAPAFPIGSNSELIRIPWEHRQSIRRLFFQTFLLGNRYCKDAILLTTDSKCPFFLPKSCKLFTIVTDLALYRMPEVYQRSRAILWRFQYACIRKRVDRFLAISEFTKQEIITLWHIPPEKIDVLPCACSLMFNVQGIQVKQNDLRKKYNLLRPFILFTGNSNPRKNLTRLMQAFDLAKERGNLSHELIIAGEQGWRFDRQKAVSGLKYGKSIRFIGFVPDDDLPVLYSIADLFAFPTLYEGFGIPVLEAQSSGVPVLTSNCSALPETAKEGAVYVDPYSVESIAEGILKVLQDRKLKEQLIKKGYENVQRFSWKHSAKRLKEIIEREIKL